MNTISLDPRINRIGLGNIKEEMIIPSHEEWNTYEVFHQKKKGQQHIHVGIVHAPNPEMAIVLAKETYGRRGETKSLWVVKTSEVFAIDSEDEDIFETTPEKIHREAVAYKVRDKIEKYKEQNNG